MFLSPKISSSVNDETDDDSAGYSVKYFESKGFNLNDASNLKISNYGEIFFLKKESSGMQDFVTLAFSSDFSRYQTVAHQISTRQIKDYVFLPNEKLDGYSGASGGYLVALTHNKGLKLMKLLESRSYGVLAASFKLSFDLAFLFVKGFMTRIGLVFVMYFLAKACQKYWRKIQRFFGIESDSPSDPTTGTQTPSVDQTRNKPLNQLNLVTQ